MTIKCTNAARYRLILFDPSPLTRPRLVQYSTTNRCIQFYSIIGTNVCISEYFKPIFYRLCMFCCLYRFINTWQYKVRELNPEPCIIKVLPVRCDVMGWLVYCHSKNLFWSLYGNIVTGSFQYGANIPIGTGVSLNSANREVDFLVMIIFYRLSWIKYLRMNALSACQPTSE